MNGDKVDTAAGKPAGKLRIRVWFDRCMLLLFLAGIVWALVATFRFHAPFDGFQILFLVLIVGLVGRPTRIWRSQGSANVAIADGSVINLKNDFPLDELKKLLTHQGGERVTRP